MFIQERWLPLRQIPDEGAAGGDTGAAEGGAEPAPPSGPGSGRSDLRLQLEKNFETDRKATEKAAAPPKKAKTAKRVAGGAEIDAAEAPAAGAEAAEAPAEGEGGQQAQPAAVAAPEGLSAEAKAAWADTPPAVQAAVAKRLADSAKGVEELKGKYAELDQALAPHMEAIRRHGMTPAQSINQLFSWFQALGANPAVAFPALAKSFNLDLAQLIAPQQQPQPGNGQDPAQPGTPVSPEVQKYINDLQAKVDGLQQAFTQKIGAVENTVAQQAQTKTNEILAMWSKGKDHFESVRQLMANLIASGAVPLKDGQVDLDSAYEMAIYANPEVRTKVLTAQQEAQKKEAAAKAAAEKKAQQEQADKARKAGVSVAGAAPGSPGTPGAKGTGKRKSVRESILEAQAELTEQ
jgi:hypothetical protein